MIEMRPKLYLMALLAMMATQGWGNPINKAEARAIAQEFIGIDDTTGDDVPVSPYYIFSRGNGRGYVIVSGDDATTPIIGYTEQGDFDYESLPLPLREMLDRWAEKIGKVQSQPKKVARKQSATVRLRAARRGVDGFKANWQDIPYLVQTHWHQSSPYNDICPTNPENGARAVTGCVATAAAQIIYYFRRDVPDTLMYDTPKYSYGFPVTTSLPRGTFINYNIMRLSGHGTVAQDDAVAKLMFAIGTSSYLTYGNSTGGQPDEAGRALNNQFLLSNTYVGKWDYSQAGWERMVYNSLLSGSPMLYGATQYADDGTASGHAVVLDGYQASTGLYHFNFGWGGQGDGWFTVDDETGMNGFNKDQRGCLNFVPLRPNVEAKMEVDALYQNANCPVKVTFTNKSTIPYASGVNLYVNTRAVLPANPNSTITDAVPVDGTAVLTFNYKPTRSQTLYLFVCDANKRILDSCSVEVHPSVAHLQVNAFTVDAGTEQEVVDDMVFHTVNNTTANVTAHYTNGEGGSFCQPILRCYLEKYDVDTKQWSKVTNRYTTDLTFEAGESKEVVYEFTKLEPGLYYRAYLDKTVRSVTEGNLQYLTADTVVYFNVRPSDLAIQVDGRHATVTGTYNDALFVESVNDATICSYDMTGVKEITTRPTVANPNAIIYTSYDVPGAVNVVNNGRCENLVINTGYEFHAAIPFTATHASLVLDRAEMGKWNDAVAPFAAKVPYGMQVKIPDGINTNTHYITLAYVDDLRTNDIFMYLPDREGLDVITAENVEVGVDSVVTLFDGALTASTYYINVDAEAMVLGDRSGLSYYLPVEEAGRLAPFTSVLTNYYKGGYRTWKSSDEYHIDIRYRALTEQINQAYLTLSENTNAPVDAVAELQAALKHAEDMFTYRSATSEDEANEESGVLKAAIEKFLNAVADGIQWVHVENMSLDGQKEYYNLNGQRVQTPVNGIVIIKQGNRVRKMYIK